MEKGGFSAVGLPSSLALVNSTVSNAERASKFGAQKGPTWSSAVKRTRRQKKREREREERRRTRNRKKKRHFPFSVPLVPKVKFGCFELSVVVVNQNIVGRG